MAQYDSWLGNTRKTIAYIDPWNAHSMAAVMAVGAPKIDDELPSLWHWLYFLEQAPRDQIGQDGHPKRGGFLPPITKPRRMFAGGRTHYKQPLKLDAQAELIETVTNIQYKSGGSGDMVIVTVRYDYHQAGDLCITEERDFIYLPAVVIEPETSFKLPEIETQLTSVEHSDWAIDLPTDPTLLFRFSALTFNSHRIHYDLAYAQQQEGYPGLVIHGPLSAMLLSECARTFSERTIRSFSFRALSPQFCGQTVRARLTELNGENEAKMLVYTPSGKVAMKATVELG